MLDKENRSANPAAQDVGFFEVARLLDRLEGISGAQARTRCVSRWFDASAERRASTLPIFRVLLVAETDHLFLKPLANSLPADDPSVEAVGYNFHYMDPKRSPRTIGLVRRFAGEAHSAGVQQVGPSPILITTAALRRVAPAWEEVSFALKKDAEADAEFGWMLEMWGYSIAAAKVGLRHKLDPLLQIEPSQQFGLTITSGGRPTHGIYHYTFGHEFSRDGLPFIDSRAGEWAFDKRDYQTYLPAEVPAPPTPSAPTKSAFFWSKGRIMTDG